jgi:hypothetical protein
MSQKGYYGVSLYFIFYLLRKRQVKIIYKVFLTRISYSSFFFFLFFSPTIFAEGTILEKRKQGSSFTYQ